jgi:hypothetical protein
MIARSITATPAPRNVTASRNILFKAASVMLRSHVTGMTPEAAATQLYGKAHGLESLITKATSAQATVANQPWAGILAHQAVGDLLQAIVSISAGAALLSRAQQISFDRRQSIRLPSRLVDPNYASSWTAEGAPIPVFQFPTAAGVVLQPHKLNVITSFTREMAELSNIETFVRSLLSESVALAVDKALFSNTQADDGITPGGLLYGVTALTAATSTVGRADAMVADVENLIGAIAAAGGGASPIFICSPPQAIAMQIVVGPRFADAVFASTILAPRTIICVEPRSVVVTIDSVTPEFDVKESPTLMMSTTPTDVIAGGPTRSMFQIDALALKMSLRDIDWKLRAPHVAWVSGTNW